MPAHFGAIADAINAGIKGAKKSLPGNSLSSTNVEEKFRGLLRKYLPTRYAVEKGFVLSATCGLSGQLDVIIADTFHTAPLCVEDEYKVFASESVCAMIEITTAPSGKDKGQSKFDLDVARLGHARSICSNPVYMKMVPVQTAKGVKILPKSYQLNGAPRCYLITSGNEWSRKETYQRNLQASLKAFNANSKTGWINAAFSLKHGLLWFKPYTEYESRWITEAPLLQFVLALNKAICTFPTGQIDVSRYAGKLAVFK